METFQTLRRNIGILGLFLPFILLIGAGPRPSISHYYYTNMGIVFTGVLWAFGLMLISYKGHRGDDKITNIAGFLIIIVSLIPTSHLAGESVAVNAHQNAVLNKIHLFSAGLFFYIMGYMSLFKFTKAKRDNRAKRRRNKYYKIAGLMVWLSISVLIPVTLLGWNITGNDVFIGETVALFFFGTSWLVKSKSLTAIGL